MTPVELSRTVLRAMRAAADAGELRVCVPEDARAVPVERPRAGGCGDYATSVALRVAREARMRPLEVAEVLSPWLAAQPEIARVDISGPGFLNLTLAGATAEALVREIAEAGLRYGHVPGDSGQHVPNDARQLAPRDSGQHVPRGSGPHVQIHVPCEVRALVVADSVRRSLRSQGTLVRVTCDAVPDAAWVDVLGICVDAPGRPPAALATPEPGLASGALATPRPAAVPAPGPPPADLAAPRPAAAPAPGPPPADLAPPQPAAAPGNLAAPRPAPAPGDRSTPCPAPTPGMQDTTPRTPRPAPGTQDTTPRPTPGSRETLRPTPAPGDPLRLGRDAARWALLHPAAHDRARVTPEQGGDLYVEQRESNPLFRVQYAHARCRALTRNAADLGFTAVPGDTPHPLLDALADYPTVLALAARHRAPDRVARHLVVVADGLLAYQHAVLPRGEEKPSAAHRARLALAEAAGTVLAGGLSLLGISAPEHL
ncbi:ArgS-related anticodon-binding protein NrtL [Streptomyces sp. A1499]|uniref:ArgS-related anticodon-binding protein NrtL n=1 Tax=Streptomyces sp. A1499 TaxID=2563104 RepID=UPI0026C315B6